jgi:glycosyltransferase involved in cell wall biosynthesis
LKTILHPEISIILPVYNRASSMKKAIESVIAQSFTNWELLIIDDCSQDLSYETAKSFSAKEKRIRVYQLDQNSGAAVARNYGIDKAEGNFISLLDSDDWYEPEFLKKSYDHLNALPREMGFIWTGVRYYKRGGIKEDFLWKPVHCKSTYLTFLNNLHIGTNSGLTFRKELFDQCGFFREDLPAAEDTEFFLRISQKFKYDYVEDILINIKQDTDDRLSKNFKKIGIAYEKFLPGHFDQINKSRNLKLKFYYKLMWLNYYMEDKYAARKYFMQLAKDFNLNFKILAVFAIFEVLPFSLASKIHQRNL